MAEQTGVTNTPSGSGTHTASSVKGKNKKWLYIGGAGVAILLLGHKGSTASAASGQDPNAQLQAESDALAQAQTDQALAAGAGGAPFPGGVAPTTVDTGGGSYTAPATTVNTAPVTVDGGSGTGANANASPALNDDSSLDKAVITADRQTIGSDKATQKADKKVRPGQPPKHTKPKPTKKTGQVHHPSEGAGVQSHTGATAHGRHFPGAQGVHVGGVTVRNGNAYQDVTVNYGSHSETHTSVNGGKQWINNKKGANPPGRGPQHTVTPAGHANPAPPRPAPARRRPAPAPARRPAPARKR